jgi:hypothetical protein
MRRGKPQKKPCSASDTPAMATTRIISTWFSNLKLSGWVRSL